MVPPEARVEGDVVVEQCGLAEEALDDEEPRERLADDGALVRGAIARVDGGHELVAPESAECCGPANVRRDRAVARDPRRSGEIAAALRVRDADHDHRADTMERDERINGVDDVREVLVDPAVRHVEHGISGLPGHVATRRVNVDRPPLAERARIDTQRVVRGHGIDGHLLRKHGARECYDEERREEQK